MTQTPTATATASVVATPSTSPEATQREPWSFTQVLALGGGLGGSLGLFYEIVQLFEHQPDVVMRILLSWGAPAILAGIALFMINGWVTRGMEMAHTTGAGMVGALAGMAAEVKNIASAQQQVADKNDRDMQEVQTTVAYNSRETERMALALHTINETTTENQAGISRNQEGIAKLLVMMETRPAFDISQVVGQALDEHDRRKGTGT